MQEILGNEVRACTPLKMSLFIPKFQGFVQCQQTLFISLPQLSFSSPCRCVTDVAVSSVCSYWVFSYLNTSLAQDLTSPSSQTQPQVLASSPLPILRSTQQHVVNNHQNSTVHNHTLVPVYIYPENLVAIQWFLLTLSQPLVLNPAGNGGFPVEPEEVDVPVSPLSELQGAGGFDGLGKKTGIFWDGW